MNILFIGGTGVISSACSQLALDRGHALYLLNRGASLRPAPEGAVVLRGDIRDAHSARAALQGLAFDAVVDWVAYTPDHIEADIELFGGRTGQFVFVSSASAYHKPIRSLPITESTPLHNPLWEYSRNKIACEERLVRAYREQGFPITIVRPSHTYDRTMLPFHDRYTVVDRMRRGQKVVIHGDGTSLWVLTHHADFAKGFVGLLGLPAAVGEAFHITSDEVLTWNQIFEIVARAAGVQLRAVHVASETIAAFDRGGGDGLLGDKAHSVIFDNSKIKRFVPGFTATIPFRQGAGEIMEWLDADPSRRIVKPEMNAIYDRLIAQVEAIRP